MRRTLTLSFLLVAALAPAARADDIRVEPIRVPATVIADGTGVAGLTAYAGNVVWSRFDPATKRWRLMHWRAGKVRTLPIAGRSVPFDASAGPSLRGRPITVYSRCRQEPTRFVGVMPAPRWETASGCSLFQLSLNGDGGERAIRRTAGAGSLTTPSTWGGFLAAATHSAGRGHLWLWRSGDEGPTELAVGSQPSCRFQRDCDPRSGTTAVDALAIGASSLAFLWRVEGPGVTGVGPGWELHSSGILSSSRPVIVQSGYVSGACGFHQPFSPSITPLQDLAYVDAASPCSQLQTALARFNARTRTRRLARPDAGYVFGSAVDAATNVSYWLRARVGPTTADAPVPLLTAPCARSNVSCELVRSRTPAYRKGRTGLGHPATY